MGDTGSCMEARLSKGLTLHMGVQHNGEELKVHKAVVCAQSRFFHTACKPESPFKEARTGLIELTEDDPVAVNGMVDYLYTRQYDCEQAMKDHFCRKITDGSKSDGDAEDNGNDEDTGGSGGKEEEGDENDSDSYTDSDLDEQQHWLMTFHLKCFVLADKYEIPYMAQYAFKRIRNAMMNKEPDVNLYYLREDFPDAIKFIYDNTLPSSCSARPLRDYLLDICREHLATLFMNPRFQTVLDPVDDFWKELARAQASIPQAAPHGPTWVKCPACKCLLPALLWPAGHDKEATEILECMHCIGRKTFFTHLGWREHALLPPDSQIDGNGVRNRKLVVEDAMRKRVQVLAAEKELEMEREKAAKRKRTA
ncbi:hypothetical protein SLS58_011084 [Diplodia intermedia]|uniref:BTB domain-containing protein n=1 Tax=Diplodia intermedia TaxID=856260 RepID=A0ABR3T1J2_9PEZI